MRIKYWGVRVSPSPLSLTSVGIGVIVTDEVSGIVRSRFLDRPASYLAKLGVPTTLDKLVQGLAQALESLNTPNRALELGERDSPEMLLNHLSSHWNNTLTIDGARYADLQSPEVALDTLYHHLVGFIRQERHNKVTRVRKRVRDEYSSIEVVREALTESPVLVSDDMRENRVDLAVISNNQVHEINRAFSFASQPTQDVLNSVESWTYKIHALRENGGLLLKEDVTIANLPATAPVVAYIWPPETPSQVELFRRATKKWEELSITVEEQTAAKSRAVELARRIA